LCLKAVVKIVIGESGRANRSNNSGEEEGFNVHDSFLDLALITTLSLPKWQFPYASFRLSNRGLSTLLFTGNLLEERCKQAAVVVSME